MDVIERSVPSIQTMLDLWLSSFYTKENTSRKRKYSEADQADGHVTGMRKMGAEHLIGWLYGTA